VVDVIAAATFHVESSVIGAPSVFAVTRKDRRSPFESRIVAAI